MYESQYTTPRYTKSTNQQQPNRNINPHWHCDMAEAHTFQTALRPLQMSDDSPIPIKNAKKLSEW